MKNVLKDFARKGKGRAEDNKTKTNAPYGGARAGENKFTEALAPRSAKANQPKTQCTRRDVR